MSIQMRDWNSPRPVHWTTILKGILMSVIAIGIAAGLELRQTASDQGPANAKADPPDTVTTIPECMSEDEVLVELTAESYGLPAGTQWCVHFDFLRDPSDG